MKAKIDETFRTFLQFNKILHILYMHLRYNKLRMHGAIWYMGFIRKQSCLQLTYLCGCSLGFLPKVQKHNIRDSELPQGVRVMCVCVCPALG